jgi:polyhydroxyalkanoate synthesis regulator phasin
MKFKASDLANKLFLAGLGLVSLTQEKARKLLKELTGREKISKADASAFVGELLSRGKETQKKLGELVKREVARILAKVDFASKKDIAELKERIEKLEAKIKERR